MKGSDSSATARECWDLVQAPASFEQSWPQCTIAQLLDRAATKLSKYATKQLRSLDGHHETQQRGSPGREQHRNAPTNQRTTTATQQQISVSLRDCRTKQRNNETTTATPCTAANAFTVRLPVKPATPRISAVNSSVQSHAGHSYIIVS